MRASRQGQRGSALLVVLVFAAIVAIMLYSELPIAVFEAKRQKEQLLIDRGSEYAHAVKLYVRKFGRYPTTVEQLEDTNRMRFLRHRYKDPFTGKDNWRMLHAGPGGQLTDSKVKPLGLGAMPGTNSGSSATGTNATSGFGSTGATGSSSGFGSSGAGPSAFGQSGFGSSSNGSQEVVVVPDLPQRPPAISANGASAAPGGTEENAGTPAEGDQNPITSLVPEAGKDSMNELAQGQPPSAQQNTGQSGAADAGAPAAGQNGAAAGGQNAPAGAGQNSMDTMRKMLTNPAIGAPLAGTGTSGTSSGMGQISGGGIAGVASIAKGHSIKVVNDQTDYSLWEFYYDPTKDATKNMPGANIGQGVGASTGQPGGGAVPTSPFGNSQSGSGQQTMIQGSINGTAGSTPSTPSNPQN
ncbi:MAG: hypothetical protein JO340_04275 [Acidobacteriaceae bacterium]|nr:hypothetical protein [Acidobacteriaceae bacterium]